MATTACSENDAYDLATVKRKGLGKIALDRRRLRQVDLPEVADAAFVHRAKIVFAARVVVFSEGIEGAHLGQQRATFLVGHGFHACGDHHHAADEAAAEIVVEFADTFDCGHDGTGHGSYLS
jgi:hypothetical protein